MSTTKSKGWLQASRYIAVLAFAVGVFSGTANAVTLSLDPAAQNVTAGSTFDLALSISGLGNGQGKSLSVFDLDVLFDTTLVTFDSFTFGSGLGAAVEASGDIPGGANAYSISLEGSSFLDVNQPGSFTLGTLHFTAIGPGTADFSISILEMGDTRDPLGEITPDLVQGAVVSIAGTQTVPDGGPGLMAAVGFGVLVLAQRKLRQHGVSS